MFQDGGRSSEQSTCKNFSKRAPRCRQCEWGAHRYLYGRRRNYFAAQRPCRARPPNYCGRSEAGSSGCQAIMADHDKLVRPSWQTFCQQCSSRYGIYMVVEKVWNDAGLGAEDNVCPTCLRKRLGRALTYRDFTSAPFNYFIRRSVKLHLAAYPQNLFRTIPKISLCR